VNLPESDGHERNAAPSRETERIRDLEAALTQAIRVIEWCGLNDRTPPYEYGEARRNGDAPGEGKTFNTPRDFAGWWPDRLREALNADA
jgi:hypothetical protein